MAMLRVEHLGVSYGDALGARLPQFVLYGLFWCASAIVLTGTAVMVLARRRSS